LALFLKELDVVVFIGNITNRSGIIMKKIFMLVGLLIYLNPQMSFADELIDAAREGNKGKVELLLSRGTDVNAMDKNGMTPLHVAAFGFNNDITELLLAKGADVNARNKDGMTPLHIAGFWSSRAKVEMLINKGANVNAKDNKEKIPLHYTALEGYAGIADVLLSKGSDINAVDKELRTPLHYASRGSIDIAELLLSNSTFTTPHYLPP